MSLIERRPLTGPGLLAITVLLMLPAALSLFASYAVTNHWLYSDSALWFVYEISFYLGIFGAIVAGALTVVQATRHRISRAIVCLMGVATVAALALVSYAAYIFKSPWTW